MQVLQYNFERYHPRPYNNKLCHDKLLSVSKQPMWNTPLQTFMVTIMMAAGLSLSACNSSEPEVSETNTLDNSEEQVVADASDSANTDLDGAVSDQDTPVVYEVSTWNTDAVTSLKINDLKAITTTLGNVVTTDENLSLIHI